MLGLTAGLTFNYSSLSAVFVSVVIMVVVFLSALLPAREASKLAAPSETMTRGRATSQADAIREELPFIFSKRDRVAVVPYLVDWFENFGEGSSGDFFCSPPESGLRDDGHGGAEPYVRTVTWLQPYDLGVSQVVEMVVRHDPDTDDNVAVVTMQRQSGDRESWERCNHRFIGHLRKRFLTWRGVNDDDRARLLERAQTILDPNRGASA